ncbi:MAG: hypothetical protein AAF449_02075, partial [Myxococcota bacterium]
NIMIQASHNGVVRTTKDIVLAGNWIRSRAWRGFALTKPGSWSFKILDDQGNTLKQLAIEVPEDS